MLPERWDPPLQEQVRIYLGKNLAVLTFLSAYFFTTVLANLIYPFLGLKWTSLGLTNFRFSDFSTSRTLGYWMLLFLPFFFALICVVASRSLLLPTVERIGRSLSEFDARDYAFILVFCYGYVIFAFWRADAVTLMLEARTSLDSVRMRFELLASLGPWPQIVLKSLLMFLSIYSFIRAFRSRETFWIGVSLLNIVLMSLLLLLLNMKWPALLFYVALAICVVLFSGMRLFVQGAVALVTLVLAYVVIAFLITRTNPAVQTGFVARDFVVLAFNRMAVGYPYYYQTFTEEGQICGTIADRIQRKINPCQPSSLIYQKAFGKDEFEGVGTQPAAVHIYGYALGGWAGALIELLLAAIIMGGFISLPFGPGASTTIQSMIVMGGLAGYFFSQLPVEAALVYDHGLVWWAGLVIGYTGFRKFVGEPARRVDD